MLVRTAFLLVTLSASAQAAAFDDLKQDLAVCLRFEGEAAGPRPQGPGGGHARAAHALQRCAVELDRLERADGRRLRGDGGLSPSGRAVIEALFGRADRASFTNARF